MKSKILSTIFIFIFLSGCSLLQTKQQIDVKVAITPDTTVTLPQPQQLGIDKTISQIVSATYYNKDGKQKNLSTNMIIEANSKHIIMVALSAWGDLYLSLTIMVKISKVVACQCQTKILVLNKASQSLL